MKTKVLIVAAILIAAISPQANAGFHGGGGGFHGGSGFAGARPSGAAARPGIAPSFHAMPMQPNGGRPMMYSGQRFSSVPVRRTYNTGTVAGVRSREVTRSNVSSAARTAQSPNPANRPSQIRGGNNLRPNWRSHVFAQHSADRHRDWDRNREHWWNGHRCRFINDSWVIFDVGFDPWWDYPYGYYGYPYPYYYDPGDYDSSYYGDEYHEQNRYTEQSGNSVVAAAQNELAREGYYRDPIDGVIGPETRRAIARYQTNRGLRGTGSLTTETLQALGLNQSASY